jgi:predicted dehydrogenase
MNWKLPRTVTGKILSQSAATGGRVPAPMEFSGELVYDGGVSAGFFCSFRAAFQQWVTVSGQKGYLRLADFIHPFNSREPVIEVNRTEIVVKGSRARTSVPVADPMEFGHPTAHDTRMWRNFAKQIASGKLNQDWPVWSVKTQKVLDACHESARRGCPVKL